MWDETEQYKKMKQESDKFRASLSPEALKEHDQIYEDAFNKVRNGSFISKQLINIDFKWQLFKFTLREAYKKFLKYIINN